MPTYQYECDACCHSFETFQSMLDKRLVKCPDCGKNKLRRLIGAGSGIIFKGSGFYETDYKRKQPSQKNSEKSDPGTLTKSDSAPCAGGCCQAKAKGDSCSGE